jgi:hypothetical protein
MRWLQELAVKAGGEKAAENLLKGRGISLILKKTDLDFKVSDHPSLSTMKLTSAATGELSRHGRHDKQNFDHN